MMTYLKNSVIKNAPQNLKELNGCILEAGSRRIRPLLMTTITTIVALIPVLWSNSTGSEIMKPMAIPVIGGMIIELITLFVVPVFFSFFEQKKIENLML